MLPANRAYAAAAEMPLRVAWHAGSHGARCGSKVKCAAANRAPALARGKVRAKTDKRSKEIRARDVESALTGAASAAAFSGAGAMAFAASASHARAAACTARVAPAFIDRARV